jgi:deazaflavin-dependent oxidoreductase (nitroreductase family)
LDGADVTTEARPARRARPSRVAVRALRVPSLLYEHGWGRLLGHRFLALTHRGRRSGRRYVTVLEVVRWCPEATEAVVVSGFGPTAQWYRNVLAGGAEQVRIGRLRFRPQARVLGSDEAAAVLAAYERRNRLAAPIVRRVLSRLAGVPYDGSPAARGRVVAALPFIALWPAPAAPQSS